jgi:GAF domain
MTGRHTTDALAALAAGGPTTEWPARLVEACRTSTGVSGVGLAVMSPRDVGGVLAATDGEAERMEDLQFTLGEGHCVDASRSGSPVLVSDLERDAGQRWPAFTADASGVLAAFTFPLWVGALGVGVLDLYRTTRGELTDREVAEALAYADAAAAVLLHLQRGRGVGAAGVDPTEGPGAPRRADVGLGTAGDVGDALDHRAVVHQAAGMISVQLAIDVPAALVRLRAHAFAANRSILDGAADVVARRLRFDHSDAGTSVTPAHPPTSSSAEEESS